jgi:hypothetical protein
LALAEDEPLDTLAMDADTYESERGMALLFINGPWGLGPPIVDAAADHDVDLPTSFRSGSRSSSAGKLIGGSVNQEEWSFLDEDQIAEGFVRTTRAVEPRSVERTSIPA